MLRCRLSLSQASLIHLAALVFCAVGQLAHAGEPAAEYQWNLPKGFPKPYVPADNPMSAPKVELGRYLFYDTRLSVNGKSSCATCHKQELAFTDGRAVGLGATGESHSRGAMSLVNVAWSGSLTWSNPQMKSLEKQALVPMYGEHPVELGLRDGDRLLLTLRAGTKYPALFAQAFQNQAAPGRITIGTTPPFPNPPNAVRFFSSARISRASAVTAVSTSRTLRSRNAIPIATWSFTIRGFTIPILRQTWVFSSSRKRRRIAASSKRPRCATSR